MSLLLYTTGLMPNIRLTLAYDGTNYCGWQVQSNGPSIQAAVEKAIYKLTGEKSAVFSAGRTDSGVHALGQVANFHTTSRIPPGNWRQALQAHLPQDIVILDSAEVPQHFHSTFSAVKKRYRYVIHNVRARLPFLRNYTYHIWKHLNAAAMHEAGQVLLGKHDFRSFETDWPNKVTSVRTVMEVTISRHHGWPVWSQSSSLRETPGPSGEEGEFIWMDIVADGFLYNMVRSIMGTLINVGRGTWTPADIERVLQAQQRSVAGNTAPASGLYLVQVDYDPAALRKKEVGEVSEVLCEED